MGTPLRVLIVEDSEEDTLLIVRELKRGGFDPIHERVETAEAMKAALSTKTWDLILADYTMPHFSGLKALKIFKASGLDLPFIIVSGSIGEDVAVEAMKAGAHDYLIKNNLTRLVPAVQQELREAEVRRKLKHSEKALKEAEKRYRQVVENAAEIIYAVDEKGNFTYANPAGLKVTGYSLQELRELNYTDLVLPDHRERVSQIYVNQFRERLPATYVEFPFLSKTGEIIWFGQNTTLVMEGDKIVGFHIIARDITERKKAEEALRESEERYRILVETSPDAITLLDLNLNIIVANQPALKLYGHENAEEVKEKSGLDYLVLKERGRAMEDMRRMLEAGSMGPIEYTLVKKDGTPFPAELKASLVVDSQKKPSGIILVSRDITERKRAEERLRLQSAALEAAANAIIITDHEGMIEWANPSFTVLTGYSHTEVVGRNPRELIKSGEQNQAFYKDLWDTILAGEVWRGQIINRRKDSGLYTEEMIITPLRNERGEISRFIAIKQDITERRRAEEALHSSENKYRTLIENVPQKIFLKDKNSVYISCNENYAQDLKIRPDEISGRTDFDFYPRELAEKYRVDDKRIMELGKTEELEEKYIQDGQEVWINTIKTPVKDEQGNLVGILGIFWDITDRKRAEEELTTLFARQKALLAAVPDIIMEVDQRKVYTWANQAGIEFFGEDVIGKEAAQYFEGEQDTYSLVGPLFEGEEGVFYVESWQRRRDGQKRLLAWWCRALKDGSGNLTGALSSAQDITDRKRAEDSLRESVEALRAFLNANPEVSFLMDTKGNILIANESLFKRFSKSSEEIIGSCLYDLFPEDVAKQRKSHFDEVFRTGKPVHFEDVRMDRNYETFAHPVFDKEGNVTEVAVLGFDITERKRAEEGLRQAEEKYRSIFENAIEGIFQATAEGRYLSVNPALANIYGYDSPEDLINTITDISHQLYVNPNRRSELIRLLQEKNVVSNFEIQIYRKDGSVRWISTNIRAVRDHNGRFVYYEGSVEDITERKRAEESLKQSEENARQLAQENAIMAEIGRIISSTLNIDEIYEGFSGEVKKIIPFDRILINIINIEKGTVRNVYIAGKGLQDRNVKDIYPLEGSGNAEMVRTKSTLLIQTEDFSEYKDRFPMLLSTFQAGFRSIMNVPLFSKGEIIGGLLLRSHKPYAYTDKDVRLAERIASQIAGAVANAQLYAERIHAEEERAALQEQLRQSQKMEAIGRLAGGIAHDFNNLLTVIKGYSQLSLAEIKGDNSLRENVEEIRKASDRAVDLTRQLLAFSRRQIMEMRVLDLNITLQNLDKMLRRVIGEDIGLVTLLAEDLGRVKADPGQIEQMIMNLVVNARDAMLNGGKLTIETANVELDQAYARAHIAVKPGPYVMVSVSDTGVGMAPEVRDRVFEPFFTTKEKGKGTGLGLSTVYGIVKQSGGNIWVYSEPGKGTTFKVYLPRVEEPLEGLKEKIVGGEPPRGSETIFIVEDEEEVLKLAGTILKRQGYHVLEAVSGEEALRVCKEKKEPFHLLLTDVVMPQMSGRQLEEQFKRVCQDFKVLYMSGYTDNAITHHGVLEKGMNYLQKPFTVDSLARKVREVLDK